MRTRLASYLRIVPLLIGLSMHITKVVYTTLLICYHGHSRTRVGTRLPMIVPAQSAYPVNGKIGKNDPARRLSLAKEAPIRALLSQVIVHLVGLVLIVA